MPKYACGSLKYDYGSLKYVYLCLCMLVEALLLHSAFSCIRVLENRVAPHAFPPLFLWRKGEASGLFARRKTGCFPPRQRTAKSGLRAYVPDQVCRGECQDSLSPGAKTCLGRGHTFARVPSRGS